GVILMFLLVTKKRANRIISPASSVLEDIAKAQKAVRNDHAVQTYIGKHQTPLNSKTPKGDVDTPLKSQENAGGDVPNKVTAPGKSELDALRKELGVQSTHTIAVGRTDVPGLEQIRLAGGSPAVRKEAGALDLDTIAPNRPIKSPAKIPLGTRHAEEDLINQFVDVVNRAKIAASDVKGTLYIHQSNPRGVCTNCIQGVGNDKTPGVFKQLSTKYPNLVIKATTETVEGVKPAGRFFFTLQNGKFIEN
ncbi:hypothetical protein, partial [Shewanella algae]|uniref:hypothetical protein n=1 Tax=Shewanella algae TaxID=38313 RepID=UPI001F31C84C